MKYFLSIFLLSCLPIFGDAQTPKATYAFLDTFSTGFFVENIGKWYKIKEDDDNYLRFKYTDTLGSCFFKFYYKDTLQFRGSYKSSTLCLEKKLDTTSNITLTLKVEDSVINDNPFSSSISGKYEYYPKRNGNWIFYRNNKIYKTIIYKEGIIISQY